MCLEPFLNTGVTWALVQSFGNTPVFRERLNSLLRGSNSASAPSFRSLPGMLSGPHPFDGSILQRTSYTCDSSMAIVLSDSVLDEDLKLFWRADKREGFSLVNTDEK